MTSSTARPPARSRVFSAGIAVFAVLVLVILLCMIMPTMPSVAPFTISVLAYSFNPFLLVLVAIGVALAVIALRRRRWASAVVAGVLSFAMFIAIVVPSIQLLRVAEERGVTLSVPELVQGPSGGLDGPTETTTYAAPGGEDLLMDVWRPENQADASNAAMVYVYGGGFESGDRTQWAQYFQHLTSQGITVFSMDYRLSTPEDPSWDESAGDVRCAVGWVHAHAEQYGIDASRIGISGGSAGGNLALLAAYSDGSEAIEPSCAVEDTTVRAVVDYYGPADLAQTHEQTPSAAVADALEHYLDATPESHPERFALLSPVSYITGQAPPTLIIQGERDTGVPVSSSTDLADRLAAAEVPHELLLLPATEHGFDAVHGGFANQIARAALDEFLHRHLID